jgi:hypothetical protein
MILDGRVNEVKNLENIVTWINSKTSKFEKGLTGILTNVYEDANAINDQIDSKIKTSMSNLESICKDTENAKKLCQGLVNKTDKDIANIKKDLKKTETDVISSVNIVANRRKEELTQKIDIIEQLLHKIDASSSIPAGDCLKSVNEKVH